MSTKKRLIRGLAAILLLFALALIVTQLALTRIAAAETELAAVDQAKHAAYDAVAELRDQHVQQTHLLLENGSMHLGRYDKAAASSRTAFNRLLPLAATKEEREVAERMAQTASELDREVREGMMPAITRGDRETAAATASRSAELVDGIADTNAELVQALDRRGAAAAARATRLRDQAKLFTILCFGLAFLCAGIVGTRLVRSIARPLGQLGEGVRKVGAGDLSARINLVGADEFAQLAGAFDQMATDLERNQQTLVSSQKLAAIGQVAAGVAHEINNPLTVILGYARLASRAGTPMDLANVRLVEQESVACQRIVQGLLDLARPQRLERTEVDLGDVAREAIQLLEESGALAGRKIDLVVPDGISPVTGDAGQLRQVVSNLLSNAIHAARERVAIRVNTDESTASIVVEDDGDGIEPDVRARVFDPFVTTKRDGTGLGLTIAQSIADAHGGRIEIDSAPGRGTRATLSLPLAAEGSPS